VQTCQEDDDDTAVMLSSEERQKILEAKQSQIRQIVGKCSVCISISSILTDRARQKQVSEGSSTLKLKSHHPNQDIFPFIFI
jgi:hypothetical protein